MLLPPIFHRPLADLSRVGSKISGLLKNLEIHSQADLLQLFPLRYEDFRKTASLHNIPLNTDITLTGTVTVIGNKKSFRKGMNITEALIEDSDSSLRVIWYNQPYLSKSIKPGDLIALSGKVIQDKYGVYMRSPQYEKVFQDMSPTHTGRLVPIYPLTQGVTQKQIRFLMKQVLQLLDYVNEWVPESVLTREKLMPLREALLYIHFPETMEQAYGARKRLQFDELFIIQLSVIQYQKLIQSEPAISIPFFEKEIQTFVYSLPFQLTSDQKKCAWQILNDIKKKQPMNRLLQGDVGSGKTVVAALVAYNCVLSGHQVALMCPTEVLAEQTFTTFVKFLPKDIRISLQTGSIKHDTEKIDIFIGTHALIQDSLKFHSLALVIIDEQHRFGVAQRKALRDKNLNPNTVPHLLSMTATPIPRSLALTLYGDLDISIIREKPSFQKPIITHIIAPDKRADAYRFMNEEIQKGKQVMVLCPLIEENDVLGVTSVQQEYEKLQKEIFPKHTVAMLHGKMSMKEKQKIMDAMKKNTINVLVATSVIEVGIDIPNATVMMIEGAERFGLAQLHQFRGRVGRGVDQSYCFLFVSSGSSQKNPRLQAIAATQDGFALAEKDLEIRGAGTVYGSMQSGFSDLRIATLTDIPLVEAARSEAKHILHEDPDLHTYPAVKKELDDWQRVFHLE